jgi:hypothetical protein
MNTALGGAADGSTGASVGDLINLRVMVIDLVHSINEADCPQAGCIL